MSERVGLPFLQGVVQRGSISMSELEIPMDSEEDEEDDHHEEATATTPLLNNTKTYGTQLKREYEKEFEDRSQIREWEVDDHKISLVDLVERYETSLVLGLDEEQVKRNRRRFGENVLIPPPKPSHLLKFVWSVIGGLNALLWGSAILSFLSYGSQYFYSDYISSENLILGCALVIVVHISGLFSFYQEFKSDKIMDSFKNMLPPATIVIREGMRHSLPVKDLVVGDLVEVEFGDLIPADIRIIECHSFTVDNSSLTGESEPQKRSPKSTHDNPMESQNLAFFSTTAVQGTAKGIVIRVGGKTLMGRLAKLASTVESGPSPITIEMNRFINIMTIRSLVFGGIFFAISLSMGFNLIDSVFFLIGIVVANIPEGLAVTFTTILSVTAKRMGKMNCLVKHLHAVEGLGSSSVICSDKTGTLTQNVMSTAHMYFNDEVALADMGQFSGKDIPPRLFDKNDYGFMSLANVAALCSRAVFKIDQEHVPIPKKAVDGDASETAILRCMETYMGQVEEYRKRFPKVFEIPFSSANKFQVSVHDTRGSVDERWMVVMKGAPERLMNLCDRILVKDVEFPMNPDWKYRVNKMYLSFARKGERVLGFCDRRLSIDEYPIDYNFSALDDTEKPDFIQSGLRFVGLISMVDPPRPSVPDAVKKCESAGIKVVMVTGDHPVTATSIARAVGIIKENNLTIEETADKKGVTVAEINPRDIKAAVVTGAELDLLSPLQLRNLIRNHSDLVFARTTPEHKYLVVEAFQSLGYVVAATGDGVNDSPALKKADIGIAMGITGTEVSKEAADFILMDDNFASIVHGVEEGRLIFDNLKKLIAYNMADNIAEMYSVWLFMLLRIPLPMGAIAMLISVLGTDVLPAISIAYERGESDIMKLKPRDPRRQTLVTAQLLSYTYGQTAVIECTAGFFSYFVTFASYGWNPDRVIGIRSLWESRAINDLKDSYGQEWTYDSRQDLELSAQTAFFVAIVLTQIANVICCKTRRVSIFKKGFTNKKMNFAIVFALALAIVLVYTPGLNSSISFVPINPILWIPPVPFMLFLFAYDEIRKLLIRFGRRKGMKFFANELDT